MTQKIVKNKKVFQNFIWEFYAQHGREFAWRNIEDPYKILISEVMLQQTQTARVALKYPPFINQFPDFQTLAAASLQDVLKYWQGLGYNRRGKYLHEIAKKVVNEYKGTLPAEPSVLITLPGLGKMTSASVVTFAFNKPTVFIETNIRAAYLHYFFAKEEEISDSQLMPLIQSTVDKKNPREWYYALMDYGVTLKKKMSNPSRRSAHYTVQSKFEGSDRQIRGMIIKMLTESTNPLTFVHFYSFIDRSSTRINKVLHGLCRDELIKCVNKHFFIP